MTKSRKAVWSEVICSIHGTKDIERPFMPPVVSLPVPKHNREKMAGCPACAREKKRAEKQQA